MPRHGNADAGLAADALTPSETVYLCGDLLAPPTGNADDIEVLRAPGTYVQRDALAHAMLTAAVLANEQAGTLRVERGEQTSWFGLKRHQALLLTPTGRSAAWPASSLEHAVLAAAAKRARKRQHVAGSVLFDVSAWVNDHDEYYTMWGTLEDLTRRGFVTNTFTTVPWLKYFTRKEWRSVLSDAGRRATGGGAAAKTERMLADCARTRPDEYAWLTAAVRHAFQCRRARVDPD